MKHPTPKATRHVNQNEGLIFEKSSPGKAAWKLPTLNGGGLKVPLKRLRELAVEDEETRSVRRP